VKQVVARKGCLEGCAMCPGSNRSSSGSGASVSCTTPVARKRMNRAFDALRSMTGKKSELASAPKDLK
jgi:hypothetical protein